jgi:hypothetical protein
MEDGLSKRKYRKVFEQYLIRCGYKKVTNNTSSDDVDEIEIEEEEIDFDAIPDLEREEFEDYEVLVYSKIANRQQQLAFYKYQYKIEMGFNNKNNFKLMFNNIGRSWLRNVKRERSIEPVDILGDSDYINITSIDAINLKNVKGIVQKLGLDNSFDKKELIQTIFETGNLEPYINECLEILKLKKTKKTISQINQIFKKWNGNQFEFVKGKGKCSKTTRVNGMRVKFVQLVGNDYN